MLDGQKASHLELEPMEKQVLKFIKSKSQTEKRISKELRVDPLVLSPVVTDLMLKGYLEIYRRRRMYFFTREFCTITAEGVSALEKARSPFQTIVQLIQEKAAETLDRLAAESAALKIMIGSARTIYRFTKAVA